MASTRLLPYAHHVQPIADLDTRSQLHVGPELALGTFNTQNRACAYSLPKTGCYHLHMMEVEQTGTSAPMGQLHE